MGCYPCPSLPYSYWGGKCTCYKNKHPPSNRVSVDWLIGSWVCRVVYELRHLIGCGDIPCTNMRLERCLYKKCTNIVPRHIDMQHCPPPLIALYLICGDSLIDCVLRVTFAPLSLNNTCRSSIDYLTLSLPRHYLLSL